MTLPGQPLFATYGEKDKMHTLLACSGDPHSLPSILAGYTDKPQGHLAPGETWWPSVGCGPFDTWWAIWWSVPDHQSQRAGMARAEVALWPIDAVPEIDDLKQVMEQLNGGSPIATVSPEMLFDVAVAMLDSEKVPVFAGLDKWPAVLAGLWPRLWPAARRKFEAWVVLSPPQVGSQQYSPWLFAVPDGQDKKWPIDSRIDYILGRADDHARRAARWMVGNADPTIDELLSEYPFPDGSVKHLKRIARAAERLDRLRDATSVTSGIDLARTLESIAPEPTVYSQQKTEAWNAVSMGLASASFDNVYVLRNLDAAHFPPDVIPSTELQQWAMKMLPCLPDNNLSDMLKVLVSGEAKQWWLSPIRDGVRAGLVGFSPPWCKTVLFWLCKVSDVSSLLSYVDRPAQLEMEVIKVIKHSALNVNDLQALCLATKTLGWSRLHAMALWLSFPPAEAFAEQLAFPQDPLKGIELLITMVSDEEMLQSAVALMDSRLLEEAARRTAVNPFLLSRMDLGQTGWRKAWSEHVSKGGAPWPDGIDQGAEIRKFLQAIVLGHYQPGPITQIPADFAGAILDFPMREKLWQCLDEHEVQLLRVETAKLVLKQIGNDGAFEALEASLLGEVFAQAKGMKLTPAAIVKLVSWDPAIGEETVRGWVREMSTLGGGGSQLGQIIYSKNWGRIAADLHSRYMWRETWLLPILHECKGCLHWWLRLLVPDPELGITKLSPDDLARRAGELGGDLAPTSLDDIWERAGGAIKSLPAAGTPAERWNWASRRAASGSLPGGLTSLVKTLAEDFPHNKDLIELKRALQNNSR